jgi:hypothetical protein
VSEPSPNARPRQVTLAGWLTMLGSVLVVLLVFDRVSGLHTIETRESVERFLAEPPGRDLGLEVDGVLSIMRTLALVAGGCAAAAAILGWHVLKRSRSARLALTILAVPLFLTGMVTGGFVSSLVAASAVMLWLQPARDWFDGITRQPAPSRTAPVTAPAAAPVQQPVQQPVAQPVAQPIAQPVQGPIAQPVAAVPTRRPSAVTWACIVTWAGSGLTALGAIASGVLLAMEPDVLLDEVHQQNPELAAQGVSDDLLIGVSVAMLAGFVAWAVAAAVIAVFVLRGLEWARITLLVSASTAGAAFLLGTALGAFLLALTLAACVLAVVLLVRPEVRAWFAARRASGSGQQPPAGAAPPR